MFAPGDARTTGYDSPGYWLLSPFFCSDCLPIIERAAADERNFVKKGVSWALRMIGRRNAELHAAAMALAERLAGSDVPAARWIGKDAVRDLNSPAVARRMSGKGTKSAKR